MPRTSITPVNPTGPYPTLPLGAGAADLVLAVADTVNLNQAAFGSNARLLLLVWNSHATTAYTVTVTSAPDALNRSGDITGYSLDAGDMVAFVFERNGWKQSDGNLYFQANNAAIKFAAI